MQIHGAENVAGETPATATGTVALPKRRNRHRDRTVAVSRRTGEGFNLIELLAVIAIISIMAALLLPALSKAKEQVTAAACLQNHKQLANAFHMYAQDNSDAIVQMADYRTGADIYPAGGFWGGPKPGPIWSNAAAAMTATEAGLQNSNAFYFYCNNTGVYHCPGDMRVQRTPTTNGPNGWAYDSYSRSQNLGGEPYDNYWGAGATYTKMSAVRQPGTTFALIEDADWRGYNVGTWVVVWEPNDFHWKKPPSVWHVNVSSVGFADGHAELHKWLDRGIVAAGQGAARGEPESNWVGPGAGADYFFVFNGYQFPGHP